MAYNEPVYQTYTLAAATISTAAALLSVVGPSGKTGRLVSVGAVVTTETTDADTSIRVGTIPAVSSGDKYGTLTVPVSGTGNGYNDAIISATDENLIPADSVVIIRTDGGCTAGAADITVTIAWF